MPQISVTRTIEERFNVSDDTARELKQMQKDGNLEGLWDWFYANETGVCERDSIMVKSIRTPSPAS